MSALPTTPAPQVNCPRLKTRTVVTQLGPQTPSQAQSAIANAANSAESLGYLVLAHSLADVGGGWMLGITVGWYE